MRGIWCLICRFEPILSDSLLTGGYPIIPLSHSLIFPSEHISDILTDSELLSGELYWTQVQPRGGQWPYAKEEKNFHFMNLTVWFWYDTVWVDIRHSNQKFLVNYCPLVFIPLLCLRFLGLTHPHSKLLLTGDVDPLFWGVTVCLTCVLKH